MTRLGTGKVWASPISSSPTATETNQSIYLHKAQNMKIITYTPWSEHGHTHQRCPSSCRGWPLQLPQWWAAWEWFWPCDWLAPAWWLRAAPEQRCSYSIWDSPHSPPLHLVPGGPPCCYFPPGVGSSGSWATEPGQHRHNISAPWQHGSNITTTWVRLGCSAPINIVLSAE